MNDDDDDQEVAMSLVSVVHFVPKGGMQSIPDRFEIEPDEMEALVARSKMLSINDNNDNNDEYDDLFDEDANNNPDDSDNDNIMSNDNNNNNQQQQQEEEKVDLRSPSDKHADIMKSLNLDEYDNEEQGAVMMLAGRNLTVFDSNADDPYITINDDDDSSDDEHDLIHPNDIVFIAGRTEQEHSVIEVYIYDEKEGNMYVHHDFSIPSFPLCTQWMSSCFTDDNDNKGGSYAAIGTFEPGIEIWNLNVMDVMEPVCVLGGVSNDNNNNNMNLNDINSSMSSAKKKRLKKKNKKLSSQVEFIPGSHESSVLCISWHNVHPTRLASGSADKTIKLWDISTQTCTNTLSIHSDKVQSVEYNNIEPSILLSGGFDRMVAMTDTRIVNNNNINSMKFNLDADIESLLWNPTSPFQFFASTDSGMVYLFDARNPTSPPIFRLAAHMKPVSSICMSKSYPNMLLTCSFDETVKIWDITDNKPKMAKSKDMQVGPILQMDMQDTTVVCGGNFGNVGLWDLSDEFNYI